MKHALGILEDRLNIEECEKYYEAKFVGEFQAPSARTTTCLLFWKPIPDNFPNRYLALYFHPMDGKLYVTDGTKIANLARIGFLSPEGDIVYSRHAHDFISTDEGMVDGGDDYLRCSTDADLVNFVIDEGKIILTEGKQDD